MQDKYKENIYKLPETKDNETLENSHKKMMHCLEWDNNFKEG